MPLHWTPTTLALVDNEYDRANASDRVSRYGAYLAQHSRDFTAWDPDPLSPSEFAAAAWRIATGPIMSPGYVRTRPDLAGIHPGFPEEGAGLIVRILVPLLHGDLAVRLPYPWADWGLARYHDDGPYHGWSAPDGRYPAVLATAEVRVTVPDEVLPVPKHTRGPGLLADAKEAVFTLAELVNTKAGPVVERLRDGRPVRA